MEDLSYEQQAHDAGYALVCGVDEAGAGPLMGPVYAAAVILPEKFELPGLNAVSYTHSPSPRYSGGAW